MSHGMVFSRRLGSKDDLKLLAAALKL